MERFYLPFYNYEDKFCEKCEIGDYEGNCYCRGK